MARGCALQVGEQVIGVVDYQALGLISTSPYNSLLNHMIYVVNLYQVCM